jgi:hypothetical protein
VDEERCPHCGAHNAPRSRWCGQCLAVLERGGPDEGGVSQGARLTGRDHLEAPPPPSQTSWATPEGMLGAALVSTALAPGGARQLGGDLPPPVMAAAASVKTAEPLGKADPALEALHRARWTCVRCSSQSSYADESCAACGASLFAPLAEPKRTARDMPSQTVLLASLLPGGGFFALGLPSLAVTRLLLSLWALGVGIVLPGRIMFVKVLYLVIGLGVWGASGWDALVTSRGDDASVILRAKVVMAVVGALLVLLLGGMVVSTPRASPDGPGLGPGGPAITIDGGPGGKGGPAGPGGPSTGPGGGPGPVRPSQFAS